MKVVVYETVDSKITDSLNYTKIKHELHTHINSFCREKSELKKRLQVLRMAVGRPYAKEDIMNTIDELKEDFNDNEKSLCGLDYSIVATKLDLVVTVTAIIKRKDIEVKKFIFRYKKDSTIDHSNTHAKDDAKVTKTPGPVKESEVNKKKPKTVKEALIETVQTNQSTKTYKKTKQQYSKYLDNDGVGFSLKRKGGK